MPSITEIAKTETARVGIPLPPTVDAIRALASEKPLFDVDVKTRQIVEVGAQTTASLITAVVPKKDFLPSYAKKAGELPIAKNSLLLVGPGGTGKTFSICHTVPKLVIVDIDNGLKRIQQDLPEITVLPFHNLDWVKATFKAGNTRDGLKQFILKDARNFRTGQALFFDSLSSWQNAFHLQTELEIPGDLRAVYGEKLKYFRSLFSVLKACPANVIMTAHEKIIRDDETGKPLTKYSPLFSGSFEFEITSYFTDIFRAFTRRDKDTTEYLWQTESDNFYNLRTCIKGLPRIIPADWTLLHKSIIAV